MPRPLTNALLLVAAITLAASGLIAWASPRSASSPGTWRGARRKLVFA